MDSVPPEPDFSIQRDNEHILIRMLQREGYLPSLFLFTISKAIDLMLTPVPQQYFFMG